MQTITIPSRNLHRALRRGDLITAIDGDPLPRPVTVATRPASPGPVTLRPPAGSAVEWRLYPDTQVARDVTVERPDPRPAVRHIDGLRLTRTHAAVKARLIRHGYREGRGTRRPPGS